MAAASDWNFTNTDHGLLVAFGEFLRQHGLLEQLMHVPIPQKKVTHTPQAKLIEFLAGIFGGIEYLSDLNDGPHPLAKDATVAQAWGVPRFAHYSGVSRTLDACDDETVSAIQQAIDLFSQPFIHTAVDDLWRAGQPIIYDLDLTGQVVSATSTTYPDTAFGWMDDQVQLGYQLARVCLSTVTGERIWLSGFHHPGDTVSTSCLQELVRAAEAQTHLRPRRRTELVRQRIRATEKLMERPRRLLAQQQAKRACLQKSELRVRLQIAQVEQGPKSPVFTAPSARLRTRVPSWQARLSRLTKQIADCERASTHHQVYLNQLAATVTQLKDWLRQLEEDNQTNPNPPVCEVRMDSGFSGGAGLTWLIEMGYQVNTKAPSDKTTVALRRTLSADTLWTRVGANAEMTSPREYHLHDCPYPLQAVLERFQIGAVDHYATLLQFRDVETPPPLADWFHSYNGRQIIEAGNKELKSGVYHIQHVMTRGRAGIQIQVLFAGLAANSVHWAMPWLRECARAAVPKFEQTLQSPKHLVRVAANSSAWVQPTDRGTAMQFAPNSALPGVLLYLKGVPAFQLPLGCQFAVQNQN